MAVEVSIIKLYKVENSYITTKTLIHHFDVSISSRDLHQKKLVLSSYCYTDEMNLFLDIIKLFLEYALALTTFTLLLHRLNKRKYFFLNSGLISGGELYTAIPPSLRPCCPRTHNVIAEFQRYYRNLCPLIPRFYRGILAVPVPMQLSNSDRSHYTHHMVFTTIKSYRKQNT